MLTKNWRRISVYWLAYFRYNDSNVKTPLPILLSVVFFGIRVVPVSVSMSACATDGTKFLVTSDCQSAKILGPHLCTRVWVRAHAMIGLLKNAIVDLPTRLKGTFSLVIRCPVGSPKQRYRGCFVTSRVWIRLRSRLRWCWTTVIFTKLKHYK